MEALVQHINAVNSGIHPTENLDIEHGTADVDGTLTDGHDLEHQVQMDMQLQEAEPHMFSDYIDGSAIDASTADLISASIRANVAAQEAAAAAAAAAAAEEEGSSAAPIEGTAGPSGSHSQQGTPITPHIPATGPVNPLLADVLNVYGRPVRDDSTPYPQELEFGDMPEFETWLEGELCWCHYILRRVITPAKRAEERAKARDRAHERFLAELPEDEAAEQPPLKRRRRKRTSPVLQKVTYTCHHAGTYTSKHSSDLPAERLRLNTKKSLKCGCTSRIVVNELESGQVKAAYYWKHDGHDPYSPSEIETTRLPRIVDEWIVSQIAAGNHPETIRKALSISEEEKAAYLQRIAENPEQVDPNMPPPLAFAVKIKYPDIYNRYRKHRAVLEGELEGPKVGREEADGPNQAPSSTVTPIPMIPTDPTAPGQENATVAQPSNLADASISSTSHTEQNVQDASITTAIDPSLVDYSYATSGGPDANFNSPTQNSSSVAHLPTTTTASGAAGRPPNKKRQKTAPRPHPRPGPSTEKPTTVPAFTTTTTTTKPTTITERTATAPTPTASPVTGSSTNPPRSSSSSKHLMARVEDESVEAEGMYRAGISPGIGVGVGAGVTPTTAAAIAPAPVPAATGTGAGTAAGIGVGERVIQTIQGGTECQALQSINHHLNGHHAHEYEHDHENENDHHDHVHGHIINHQHRDEHHDADHNHHDHDHDHAHDSFEPGVYFDDDAQMNIQMTEELEKLANEITSHWRQ